MTDPAPITPPQSRAGRALLGWSVADLAAAANVSSDEIEHFEAEVGDADTTCQRDVRTALEAHGVLFLPEVDGVGAGARFKFPRQTVKRLQTWEGEGGSTGEDDIA
ncbi:hypothetical protein WH87_05710 [Devosia epidermidihirudinis]|uniref:XRE family transcriptional regulator n=1 Tax=Devosia epidermidihirudinis TaxID=1293439 RepID=A0A0F5QG27_9HYPH|nr:hypothetical protein [Devosia epidermidihirudinis]KKC39648.1 hypothetical protein WH87_05710 [Devosia epidermidihirudinis]